MKQASIRTLKTLTMLTAAGILLGGCAMPMPMRVASWAVDGISYLATEKSVVDNGLSALSGRDCAMLNLASGEAVCQDSPVGMGVVGDGADGALPAFATAKTLCDVREIADDLSQDGGALNQCARRLVDEFGVDGALAYTEWHIGRTIDAGDTDAAGVWIGAQAQVRQVQGNQAAEAQQALSDQG